MYFIITLLIVNVIAAILIKIYCKLTTGICKYSRHLVGKVVIVTGSNSGIGYETAKDFADRGARVILAYRYKTEGTAARDSIISTTGNTNVHCRQLDLASLNSVKAFAEDIIKTEKRLDILVNNAGVYEVDHIKTEDGLSLHMQTNYFGHFLLTSLLLPLLKSSAPSRIINVSSKAHRGGKIDFDNLNNEKETERYSHHQVYQNSNMCIISMTLELARKLKGTGVTSNCLNPGFVATNMMESRTSRHLKAIMNQFFKTPWEGAQTTIFLAVSPEVEGVNGKYYSDCREDIPAVLARDEEVARKLWEVSEEIVGIKK